MYSLSFLVDDLRTRITATNVDQGSMFLQLHKGRIPKVLAFIVVSCRQEVLAIETKIPFRKYKQLQPVKRWRV